MASDSAASLLFKIGSDTSNAEGNIARFRALFSKDLGSLKTDFHNFAASVTGGGDKIGMSWTSIAGIAAGAAVSIGAALFALAKKTAEQGEQFEILHQQTGVSVSTLSAMKVVAGETGVSFDTLTRGMEIMDRGLSPVASSSATAGKALQMLGLSANTAGGQLKDNVTLLAEVADKFHAMKDGSEKTAIAMSIFGRSGADMIPILDKGGAAIRGATAHAKAMGMTFTQVSANQSVEFLESFRDIKYTVEGVGVTIGQKVLPLITSAMQMAANFIVGHAHDIQEAISGLGDVFKALLWVVEKDFEILEAFGDLLNTTAVLAMQALQLISDALHRNFSAAKRDFSAMHEAVSEGWRQITGEFKDGSTNASAGMEALGKSFSAMFTPKTQAATTATDKFASALSMATEQIHSLQDQMSKPQAAIEAQFTRGQQAAERQIESYRRLAQQGKISSEQLAGYEREYTTLVEDLAKERTLKLQQLDRQRVQSVEQLDQSLRSKIASFSAGALASKKAAIEKEIAAEKARYAKLGALDAAHMKMIEELRADLLHQLDEQEQAAARKKQQLYQNEFNKLKALSGQYTMQSLTASQRIQASYQQEIQKVKQLEEALLKMAKTEQQRAQVTEQANVAITAAYKKEQTQLEALTQKHQQTNKTEKQLFSEQQKEVQKFTQQYGKAIQMLIKALEQQLATELLTAKTSVAASTKATAEKGKNIGLESAWKGAKEFAEGLASLAAFDFAGAAEHFAASGSFLSVAASVGVAAAGLLGGSSGGSGGGRHAAKAHAAAKTTKAGKAGSSAAQSQGAVVNVHIDGIVSADTLSQVMDQINSAVANGSASMTATHVVAGGAVMAVPQGAF